MNKLTKIGVSALCGSLAAVSAANAGEMTVTGGATMTYTQLGYGETGNPLGMATGLTFTGSGELDNGNKVTLTIAHDDKNTFSAAAVNYEVAGLGTFSFDQGGGTGLDRIDDMMPTAWEETTGTGVGGGLATVSGAGGMTDIEWAISPDMLPDGTTAYISWTPKADGSKSNDKAAGGATGAPVDGAGWDVVVQSTSLVDGLTAFAGYSTIAQAAGADSDGDRTSHAIGATYAVGSWTLGYQVSRDNEGHHNSNTAYYDNTAWGIAFNVSDDLSLSYGEHESERARSGDTNVTLEASSFQLAYSMGGASIKIAETDFDNSSYVSTTAGDKDGTTIAVTLAF
jgi:outer membrane protein OmpU